MGIRSVWTADTRDEADSVAVMLRAMGLDVAGPTHMSYSGEWIVRALPAGQRGQRHGGAAQAESREAS